MKISKSKQELARIINENGGWCRGNYAVQDKDDKCIWFMFELEGGPRGRAYWPGSKSNRISCDKVLPNWHQTILSRDEYFHLHPAPDADGCVSLGSSVERDNAKWLADGKINTGTFGAMPPPTIEQLAADYRNAKDCAERKQQEADAAKADTEAKLKSLELAGEALGLKVSPITAKQDPELVIAVQVGDEVECIESNVYPHKYKGMVGTVLEVDDSLTPYLVDFGGDKKIWCHEVKFIRRP